MSEEVVTSATASSNTLHRGDTVTHKAMEAGTKVKHWISGSFPGTAVNHSVRAALHTPADARCYERVRDAILRFFVNYQKFFVGLALFMAFAFVVNFLVAAVSVWGAVFGVAVLRPDDVCKVDLLRAYDGCIITAKGLTVCTSTGFNVSYEGNAQYPPQICVGPYVFPDTCDGDAEYVSEFCNLSQQMFNVNIKVRGRGG